MGDEDDRGERKHQSSVLREMADRIDDGTAPPLSRDTWVVLLREYSDRVSADSARHLRIELRRRQSEVENATAARLRTQLEARRGKPRRGDR